MDDKKDIQNLHTARGRIYAFLSNVFMMQPDDTFYKMVSEMLLQLAVLSSNDEISKGVNLLNKFMVKKAAVKDDDYNDFNLEVQRKYTYIMCIPNNAPQEESYYTSSEHLLNQESYEEMALLYEKYKIALDDSSGLSYDHISAELKFMSFLSYKSSEQIVDNDVYHNLIQEQYDFHTNHFEKWVDDLFSNISKSAGEDELLYNGIVYIARGFIKEDKSVLEQLLSYS